MSDKVKQSIDPVTAVLSAVFTLIAAFGVWTKLGVDTEQVTAIYGAVFTIVSTIQAVTKSKDRSLGKIENAGK